MNISMKILFPETGWKAHDVLELYILGNVVDDDVENDDDGHDHHHGELSQQFKPILYDKLYDILLLLLSMFSFGKKVYHLTPNTVETPTMVPKNTPTTRQ